MYRKDSLLKKIVKRLVKQIVKLLFGFTASGSNRQPERRNQGPKNLKSSAFRLA